MMLAADLKNPSWRCVHFTAPEDARAALGPVPGEGIAVFEVDAADITGEQELLAAVSRSLRFPSYFGMNWDAMDECLSDLEWVAASGYVVLVTGADHLWRHSPRAAGRLVSSWLHAAERWSEDGKPFHLVFAW